MFSRFWLSGQGTVGMEGIQAFLGSHVCNSICTALGLDSVGRAKSANDGTQMHWKSINSFYRAGSVQRFPVQRNQRVLRTKCFRINGHSACIFLDNLDLLWHQLKRTYQWTQSSLVWFTSPVVTGRQNRALHFAVVFAFSQLGNWAVIKFDINRAWSMLLCSKMWFNTVVLGAARCLH